MSKIIIAVLAGVFTLSAATAWAAEEKSKKFKITDEITRNECGDCHMAFQPSQLPAGSWKKIMATLIDHFGEDASLDAKTAKHIEDYLVARAFGASGGLRPKMIIKKWAEKGLVNPIRITVTPGWTRHHKSAKYRRMSKEVGYSRGSNCVKCHKDAETGHYEEFDGMYGFD